MKDIAPELLEKIKNDFEKLLNNNTKIKELEEILQSGKATYEEANGYSVEVGKMLAKCFQDNLSSEILPDGKMYFNIANRIIPDRLKENYKLISDYAKETQTQLNKEAGLNINGVAPKINQDKIDGIVNRISSEENYDDISWILNEPLVNFSQAIIDDTIKANVELHHKLGLQPKIKRKSNGKCCKWCSEIVGEYKYPDEVPEDVYRRHNHCTCEVDYYPGDGKVQNVHTKAWGSTPNTDKESLIEEKKQIAEIKNAKTIKEANKIAKDMGFQADYGSVDLKCANEWNLGLYNAKKDFPEIADKINFVGSTQKRNTLIREAATKYYEEVLINTGTPKEAAKKLAKKYGRRIIGNVSPNNMASSIGEAAISSLPEKLRDKISPYLGITINEKYFDKYGKVIESGIRQVKEKWHPEGCFNVKATFDHEFAHQIDDYLNIRENEKIKKIFDEKTFDEITEALSEYSWNNNNPNRYSEMIAEGWSEYCNNDKPREMAKAIGEEIKRIWKKKNT